MNKTINLGRRRINIFINRGATADLAAVEDAWMEFVPQLNQFGTTAVLGSKGTSLVGGYWTQGEQRNKLSLLSVCEKEIVEKLNSLRSDISNLKDSFSKMMEALSHTPSAIATTSYDQKLNTAYRINNCMDVLFRMSEVFFRNIPAANLLKYEALVSKHSDEVNCFGSLQHAVISEEQMSCRGYNRDASSTDTHLSNCFRNGVLMCSVYCEGKTCVCTFGCNIEKDLLSRTCPSQSLSN